MRKLLLLLVVFPLVFVGCSEEEVQLPAEDITLRYGETKQLANNPYGGMSVNNKFIASIEGGTIRGRHVGETTAVLQDGRTVKVEVTSNVTSIKEISREWGVKRYKVINNSELGDFYPSETSNDIWQALSADGKILYSYNFDNGVLTSSAMAVHKSLLSELADYLKERFTLVDVSSILSGGYDADNIDDAKTIVGITVVNANYYFVAFIPNEQ